jgi:hypothetical protein
MNTYRSAKQKQTPPSHAAVGCRPATLLLLFTLLALACADASAQDAAAQQPRDDAPPPLRYLPDEVRRRLEEAKDAKTRARLSMEIAEERLARAAQHAEQDRFEAATGEIGVYEAVVEDTIRTLHGSGRVNNKLRDIFKRVEITLRSHVTRLESIRRMLPERHAVYLKSAIEFVRDHRDKALAAFYSDSVIREPHRPELTTPSGERATSSAGAQPEPEKKPDQKPDQTR